MPSVRKSLIGITIIDNINNLQYIMCFTNPFYWHNDILYTEQSGNCQIITQVLYLTKELGLLLFVFFILICFCCCCFCCLHTIYLSLWQFSNGSLTIFRTVFEYLGFSFLIHSYSYVSCFYTLVDVRHFTFFFISLFLLLSLNIESAIVYSIYFNIASFLSVPTTLYTLLSLFVSIYLVSLLLYSFSNTFNFCLHLLLVLSPIIICLFLNFISAVLF